MGVKGRAGKRTDFPCCLNSTLAKAGADGRTQRGDQADQGRASPQRLSHDAGAGGGREGLGAREGPPVWGD